MSINTKSLDIEKLTKVIIISNTPNFLYNSFVRNQSILDFSFRHEDQVLIAYFYFLINETHDLSTRVFLYSTIVAISLKQSAYVDGFFKNLKESNYTLKWTSELADIYLSKITTTNSSDIGFKYQSQNPIITFPSSISELSVTLY